MSLKLKYKFEMAGVFINIVEKILKTKCSNVMVFVFAGCSCCMLILLPLTRLSFYIVSFSIIFSPNTQIVCALRIICKTISITILKISEEECQVFLTTLYSNLTFSQQGQQTGSYYKGISSVFPLRMQILGVCC